MKNDARASARVSANEMVKEIPEYDETAPSYIADGLVDLNVPFEASYGQDPRSTRPQRSYKTPEQFEKERNETIANYYGFPTAEAHAAAKEKGWTPYTQAQEAASAHAEAEAKVSAKREGTTAEATRAHVGTGAIARPGGPAVPVRSAVAPSALTPHNVTKPAATNPANSGANSAPRKPPAPAKQVPASVQQAKAVNAARPSAPRSNMV